MRTEREPVFDKFCEMAHTWQMSDLQGGAFFFMEHVVADPATWSYFFQHVLQPFWYYFGDGCETTRETWKHLESAGFSELKMKHIEAPLVFVIKPHIVGYAVK